MKSPTVKVKIIHNKKIGGVTIYQRGPQEHKFSVCKNNILRCEKDNLPGNATKYVVTFGAYSSKQESFILRHNRNRNILYAHKNNH